MTMKRTRYILLATLSLALFACERENLPDTGSDKSIVILYENDVHCAIDGYTRLAGLRDAIAASDTAWTATVSCGDYLQGGNAGALSRGQYIVDVMKAVGYDAITLGNHEFDYGAERMLELVPQIGAPVLCANLYEYGSSVPRFAAYTIKEYGSRRVAFVGVTTPESMIGESYSFYDKDGKNPQNKLLTSTLLRPLHEGKPKPKFVRSKKHRQKPMRNMSVVLGTLRTQ